MYGLELGRSITWTIGIGLDLNTMAEEYESGSLESWYSFHSFVTDIYRHVQCTVINMSDNTSICLSLYL